MEVAGTKKEVWALSWALSSFRPRAPPPLGMGRAVVVQKFGVERGGKDNKRSGSVHWGPDDGDQVMWQGHSLCISMARHGVAHTCHGTGPVYC